MDLNHNFVFNSNPNMNFFSSFNSLTLLLIVGLAALILYYVFTLYKCMKLISEENRAIKPWTVWLLLIPFFGQLWTFFVVAKIAKSLQAEDRQRNLQMNKIFEGKIIGFSYGGFNLLSFAFPREQQETVLIIACMFWLAYWAILWQQTKILRTTNTQPITP